MSRRVWTPALTMLLVSLISYIDRSTLALLAPTILRETGISGQQYGFIISAFSVAYMLSNPIWGWILDRAGLRRGMSAAVAWWSAASVAHVFGSGFWSFGAARAALGFGEGATFPGGLRTVVQTLPPEKRGRGLAVAYSGGSLGSVVTPLLVTPVFERWGWRGAFWFTGMIGAAWLVLWSKISTRPDIRAKPAARDAGARAPRFADPALWAFMCAYAMGALPLGFVLYNAPLYLANALGASQRLIGELLWAPPLGWELGYFVWGWFADRLSRRGDQMVSGLGRLMAACGVMSLGFAAIPLLKSPVSVMAALFFVMFVASGFIVLPVAYATHVYSPVHAGLIAGAGAGAWSFLVAVMMPLFGHLFDIHAYRTAFWVAGVVPIGGYFAWRTMGYRSFSTMKG